MFKKSSTLLLLIFSVLINAQEYDSIRFENILKNSSAKDLFIKKIISKDKTIYEDENLKKYNSVEAFEEFKYTRNAAWIDMIMIDQNENRTTIGKMYGINRYSEDENYFSYDILNFNRFILFSDINDEIVAIQLKNDSENLINVDEFISKYSEKYKKDFSVLERGKQEYYFYLNGITIRLTIGQDRNNTTVSPSGHDTEDQGINIELVLIYNEIPQDVKNFLNQNLNIN